ncbi:universal stress protein [Bdellovibrio sp. 22V]|uniref:universal stress protein n=1 Tax=Bdellovibrio TaxID=958 RepID=UPI00254328C5|nr:universal stress protein [Bdellovibrio sp. 22V]WII71170.1 universal stress protein [Bdellovibrio sp. 22V]
MRIIWAIDAFEDNKELNQKMADYITHLHNTTGADIEPLYLLRENEIVLPTYEVPAWVTDHSRTAESLFREVLADYNLPFLMDAKVIPHASQSHAGAAETLSNYAMKVKADLIVVGSHGRQGFQRFILGSFAESLLLQSEVPVCVVGSHAMSTRSTKNILFPTEFGEHSKDNFKHILQLAKMLRAEVLLLHAIARPIESLFDLDTRPRVYNYKGKMLTLEQIVESQIESQSHHAQLWVDWAQKEGVTAHFFIDSSFKAVDELVLEAVQKHEADLIVMEAQSGPMSAALLGSYTRNVVRKAPCPVYVLTRHFYDKQEDRFTEVPAP